MQESDDSQIGGTKSKRHVIGSITDLPPGRRIIVQVGRREIGIFNVNGRLHALRNVCPHRGAPICKGRLRPLIVADAVGDVTYAEEERILKCPWHLWEFDVQTGRARHDESVKVQSFIVRCEENKIVLYL